MKIRYKYIMAIWAIIIGVVILHSKLINREFEGDEKENPLIGRWLLQDSQSSDGFEVYELEFVDTRTLICNFLKNGQRRYNVQFQYTHIEEDKIKITAPRQVSSEWRIINTGHQLYIEGSPWPQGTGVFSKTNHTNWLIVALFLNFFVIGAFFVDIPGKTMGDNVTIARQIESRLPYSTTKYLLNNLIVLISFVLGIIVGFFAWSLPVLLRVKLPWDAIVTLELSIILLTLGLRILLVHYQAFMEAIMKWEYPLGAFLFGAGILGIIVGVGRILIFVELGYYL